MEAGKPAGYLEKTVPLEQGRKALATTKPEGRVVATTQA